MHFYFCSHLLVFEDHITNSILLVCPFFLFSSFPPSSIWLFWVEILGVCSFGFTLWILDISQFLNELRLEISLCHSLSHPNTAIVYQSIVSYRPELIKHSHKEKVLKDLSKNGHFTEYCKNSKLQLTSNWRSGLYLNEIFIVFPEWRDY